MQITDRCRDYLPICFEENRLEREDGCMEARQSYRFLIIIKMKKM